MNLYDTTTDTDIHINQQLIEHGFAWPDPFPDVSHPAKEIKVGSFVYSAFESLQKCTNSLHL